jgi:hypothetical protein
MPDATARAAHNGYGTVVVISGTLARTGGHMDLIWFDSPDGCEAFRKDQVRAGTIPDSADLR